MTAFYERNGFARESGFKKLLFIVNEPVEKNLMLAEQFSEKPSFAVLAINGYLAAIGFLLNPGGRVVYF